MHSSSVLNMLQLLMGIQSVAPDQKVLSTNCFAVEICSYWNTITDRSIAAIGKS